MDKSTPQHWITQYPQAEVIRALWMSCSQTNASIAIWKKPQSDTLYFLADFSEKPKKIQLQLHKALSGFAISPFINPDGEQTLLLQTDLYICFKPYSSHQIVNDNTPSCFWESTFNHLKQGNSVSLAHYANADLGPGMSNKKDYFINIVRQALLAIKAARFDKVIVARDLTITLSKTFNIIRLFKQLSNTQPDTFVSLVSIKGHGTWMGASPEILVKTDQQGIFHTDSVAGTQAFSANNELATASWSQKEIEEQAMVSRYIIEQFKKLRLREFVETGPRSTRAGALIHLKTHYQVDMKALRRPTLATEMLHLLHPTSAVCGLPKQPAMQFIEAHEAVDRAYYCGYLGPVNLHGESNLYVNLRCMQIQQNQLVLYAGSGITHDSDPEKEWQETMLKCDTLLDVINDKQSHT